MTTGFAEGEMARLREAAAAVRRSCSVEPRAGVVLGTGLGGAAAEWDVECEIPYEEIPHFPRSTASNHRGRLVLARLRGAPVVAMQGRIHLYEGYSAAQVVFPVRVLKLLGARDLVVTAAAGCLHDRWRPGDWVALDDHVNLQGTSPLIGPNLDELGPRFPDMSAPYDEALRERAAAAAAAGGVPLRRGVYAAVRGPQLETGAENRMLRAAGADVVGMSTVPETIAARHMGMRVLGLSVVANTCLPVPDAATAESVAAAAQAAQPALLRILSGVLGDPAIEACRPAAGSPGDAAAAPPDARLVPAETQRGGAPPRPSRA